MVLVARFAGFGRSLRRNVPLSHPMSCFPPVYPCMYVLRYEHCTMIYIRSSRNTGRYSGPHWKCPDGHSFMVIYI